MKKLLSILAVMVALVAVSCTNEPEGSLIGKAKVTYTVDGPSQIATKAMGTISSAYTLYYEVRLWDGSALGEKLTGDGLSGSKTVAADQWPTTVTFDLARGKQYKILFWAQSTTAPAGLFTIPEEDGLTAIAIDYTKMAANNEACDAFSGSDVITPTGAMAASATLTRPFALLNLGASDAVQFHNASGGATVGSVAAKIGGDVATTFNVANGEAGTALSGTFTATAAPIDTYDASTLSASETNFNYLSAVYVLPLAASGTIGVEYTIKDNATVDITSLEVTNVPVKTNYRTNITGKLLTGTTTYNISVDQAFTGDTDKNATPSFASIAALNTFFATNIATGPNDPDHGDIFPETVIVTAIPEGDATTITLPNDTLSVAINILVPYSEPAGLTIAYPVAEGAKHSQNVYFNMAGLSKLTANLPDTHLEVVSGSNIDLSDVYTSAGTFVVQEGARVGVLNIKQGNAFVAGSIDSLKVNTSATSDGQTSVAGNAVQVFLAKESAVEKIVLNSKTDVVVEQPKDHIDVEETEKKVAVYVNDGADNSTATARNGGVIYVEANVPCTVTADGTSTAEEGNVSSTVIIKGTATGSAVVATNGGSIDLTANASCSASAEGTSEAENPSEAVPSTINVTGVKNEDIIIDASTSAGGEIETSTETAGAVKYYVAQIVGGAKYESLAEAFAAVTGTSTINILANCSLDALVDISDDITLVLNGHTITNKATSCRMLRVNGGHTLTIDGTVTGSAMVIDSENYASYGFVNLANNSADNALVVNGGSYSGAMLNGALFKALGAYQHITLNGVTCTVDAGTGEGSGTNIHGIGKVYDSNNYAFLTINNSVINCNTTNASPSVAQAALQTELSIIDFDNVTINTVKYGGFSPCYGSVNNCTVSFPDGQSLSWANSALTIAHGELADSYFGYADIKSGTYEGQYGINVLTSGAYAKIEGGSFSGTEAALFIHDNSGYPDNPFDITISGGEFIGIGSTPVAIKTLANNNLDLKITGGAFTGALDIADASKVSITGGYFSDDPTLYLGSGSMVIENPDANANVYPYKVVPSECNVYTPAVEASVDNDAIVFNRVKTGLTKKTFAQAVATATAGQVIELSGDIDCSGQTINVAGGVAIDFAGYTLTAAKVVGNNGKVLFKQSKKYDSIEAAAAEVAQGYLSYVGSIENVEIWGGTYAFDPQDYTPSGLALVANGAAYEMPGKWFVPSIPEALVYHGTQQEMEDNSISFTPNILAIERNGGEALINLSNPVGQLSLPIQNGAYAFLSDDDESPLTSLSYQSWIADFIVSINQDTDIAGIVEGSYNTQYPIPSWGIWGAYGEMQFAPALCFNLEANERFPLLGSMGMGWDYNAMRNTVHTFICGAVNVHPGNVGKVVTAELCIAPSNYSSMAAAIAAGEYIVVGKYQYTMEAPYYNITQFPGLIVQ